MQQIQEINVLQILKFQKLLSSLVHSIVSKMNNVEIFFSFLLRPFEPL